MPSPPRSDLHVGQVAERLLDGAVVGRLRQHHAGPGRQLDERAARRPAWSWARRTQLVDDGELAALQRVGERRAQRPPPHLLVHPRSGRAGVGPCATPPPTHCGERIEPWRARPVPFWRHGFLPPPATSPRVFVECVPARGPRGRPPRPGASAARSPGASKISAARSREPFFFPAGVEDLDRRHQATPSSPAPSPRTGPSRARPRGRAPRPSRAGRPRSGSACTTSRFSTVTRSLPCCPAIRMPLNTRLGVAQAPIAPGAGASARSVARLQAGEPVALHHPGEALALGHADHVGPLAGRNVGPDLLARLVGRRVVGPQLHQVPSRAPRRLEVARIGLGDVAGRTPPVPELDGVVAVALLRLDLARREGPALITVTGTARVSSKTWVIPSFSPRMPFVSGSCPLPSVHGRRPQT